MKFEADGKMVEAMVTALNVLKVDWEDNLEIEVTKAEDYIYKVHVFPSDPDSMDEVAVTVNLGDRTYDIKKVGE